MKRYVVSGFTIFVLALAGCGGAYYADAGGDCRVDGLCPHGTICNPADGFCYAEAGPGGCVYDEDCGPGGYCAADGVCYTSISGCSSDFECAPGFVCWADGVCRHNGGCSYDTDCAPGFYCASDGVCYHG